MELRAATPRAWLDRVLDQFDHFLLDHAAAERKASAMAVSFVVQYPDKYVLHEPMIRIAREELLHYQQVMRLIHQRRLIWERDEKDPYVRQLIQALRTDRRGRLLDRLLVGAVVEQRGVERFGLIGEHQQSPSLRNFYERLSQSEKHHADQFATLAESLFEPAEVRERLAWWLDVEAEAMMAVPIRPALH